MQNIKISRQLASIITMFAVLVFLAGGLAYASTVYHGNTKSHVFHAPGCRYYNCKKCVATFASREEAISAGYRACKVCKP